MLYKHQSYTKRQNIKAFTLLEMLLALALLSMLMISITQLISYSADVWGTSEETIENLEDDKVALDFIRKILARAKPINWKKKEPNKPAFKAFKGENDRLYFVAPLPVINAASFGLHLFSLSVRKPKTESEKALVIDYWPLDEESLEKTIAHEVSSEVLMTEVEEVQFDFYGDNDYSNGLEDPQWHTNWAARDFPLGIKMTLTRTKKNKDTITAAPRNDWKDIHFSLRQRTLR